MARHLLMLAGCGALVSGCLFPTADNYRCSKDADCAALGGVAHVCDTARSLCVAASQPGGSSGQGSGSTDSSLAPVSGSSSGTSSSSATASTSASGPAPSSSAPPSSTQSSSAQSSSAQSSSTQSSSTQSSSAPSSSLAGSSSSVQPPFTLGAFATVPGTPAPPLFKHLAVDPASPNRVYGTTLHAVMKSSDNGATWAPCTGGWSASGTVGLVAVDANGKVYVAVDENSGAADRGGVWVSADPCSSFTRLGTLSETRIVGVWVDPDGTNLYAKTLTGFFHSPDSGGTWTAYSDASAPTWVVAAHRGNGVTYAGGLDQSPEQNWAVFETRDDVTWTQLGILASTPEVIWAQGDVVLAGVVNGSGDVGAIHRWAGGPDWSLVVGSGKSARGFAGVPGYAGSVVAAVNRSVFVSHDTGATWVEHTTPEGGQINHVAWSGPWLLAAGSTGLHRAQRQ